MNEHAGSGMRLEDLHRISALQFCVQVVGKFDKLY